MSTQRLIAAHKVLNYSVEQCQYGIADCHETLAIGQYAYESDYGRKLWAEIDAMRDRIATLERAFPKRGGVLYL